jgi:hypothetical protein
MDETDFQNLYIYLDKHRTSFLHTLKGYAQGLVVTKDKDPCSGVGDGAVEIMNTYFLLRYLKIDPIHLVIHNRHKELVDCMAEVVDITLDESKLEADLRSTSGRVVGLLDNMVSKYDSLIAALKPKID